MDFHRFPLSIGKNHLIAIHFYRLTTLGDTSSVPEAKIACPLSLPPLLLLKLTNFKDIWAHAIEVCLSYTRRFNIDIFAPAISI